MKKNRLQTIVLAAIMLLTTFAVAQQEVAPDHFDGTPTSVSQKARGNKPAKQAVRKTSVVAKHKGSTSKEKDRQIAMLGK